MNQIVNVELPRVVNILKMEKLSLKFQHVKEKDHYICNTKLEALWQEKLRSNDSEAKLVREISKMVKQERVGDRAALGFDVEDNV
ncbi:hypothetical protein D3C75_718700 [compost metagenome]